MHGCVVIVFVVVFSSLAASYTTRTGARIHKRMRKRSLDEAALSSPKKECLSSTALHAVNELAETKKKAIAACSHFTEDEIDNVVKAIRNIIGDDLKFEEEQGIRAVARDFAHTSHKIWAKTEEESIELEKVLPKADTSEFKRLFFRVLEGGQFDKALDSVSARRTGTKPWAVLITGLNGIRKSTSVYQSWFQDVLYEALSQTGYEGAKEDLPTGHTTFFRQLDYIVATLANEEFRQLYDIPSDDVDAYAMLKDAIFARYRKLAEMVGMLLIRVCRKSAINVAVETSGRDVAMFKYIDHCFPASEYNKLVVHFTINEISFACSSVDMRMTGEIAAGASALASLRASKDDETEGDGVPEAVRGLVEANAGGPYGSAVLPAVEAASNKNWESIKDGSAGVGDDWFKAGVQIIAHKDKPWEARAAATDASIHVFKR